MTRRYDDPVDVRRRDEAPAEFLWRGRLYVVSEVLAHWVETGAWWQAAGARPVYGEQPGVSLGEQPGSASGGGDPARAESAAVSAVDSAVDSTMVSAVDDAEREVWRVEATAGRVRGRGVYDLTFDWSAGAWTLARALD